MSPPPEASAPGGPPVLVLNCGSSSVKFAVVDPADGHRAVSGLAERVGTDDVVVQVRHGDGTTDVRPRGSTHADVLAAVLGALDPTLIRTVHGVGHRVVHGGHRFTESVLVDDEVLAGLREVAPMAPLHAPANVAGIEAAAAALPGVAQVAVFDTAFHHTLPPKAYRYAVPAEWYAEHGARRFGFHGISHRYVAGRAAEVLGRPLGELRLVTAHLGNGCSASAVRGGVSVDTTMGFTPLEGLVMGTRSGDVDPGLLGFLAPRLGLDLDGLVTALNTRSGLTGLSGRGNDVREIVAGADAGDEACALALELFAYRLAKAVAALTVPLRGLDAVVLTGGIGEHSARVRALLMAELAVLGVAEDPAANRDHGRATGGRVSTGDGPVVLVVPTDEEVLIARDTAAVVTARR